MRALLASRAADGGSAGAVDGSSTVALTLAAALAGHPHAQVAAPPFNAPTTTAASHTAALSPATARRVCGVTLLQQRNLRLQWLALDPFDRAGREGHASRAHQVREHLPSA